MLLQEDLTTNDSGFILPIESISERRVSMATLVRWEPFREIATLQNEMSRLMNTFTGDSGGSGSAHRSWVPALDVWETEAEIVYALDLPGIPEDDISVEFE